MQCVLVTSAPTPQLLPDHPLPTPSLRHALFFKNSPLSPVCAAHLLMSMGLYTGVWSTYRGQSLKEDWPSLPQESAAVNNLSTVERSHTALLNPWRSYWLAWSWTPCTGNRAVSSRPQQPCCVRETLFLTSPPWPLAFRVSLGRPWDLSGWGWQISHLWLSTPLTFSALWPVVNFCVNHYPQHEIALIRSKSCTNL